MRKKFVSLAVFMAAAAIVAGLMDKPAAAQDDHGNDKFEFTPGTLVLSRSVYKARRAP